MNIKTQEQIATISLSWQGEFETYLREERRWASRRRPAEKTVWATLQHVRVFVAWWEAGNHEEFMPSKATNYDLMAYRQWSLDVQKCAAATWNARRAGLAIFTAWVEVLHGSSYAGLMNGVESKEALVSGCHQALDEEEYNRLMRRMERRMREAVTVFECQTATRDWAALAVMLHAGLRVDEAASLDVGDIEIGERNGRVRVRNGKGDKERNLPLGLGARRAVSAWLEIRPAGGEGLFTGKRTERLSTRQLERITAQVGMEVGIPGLKPHDLRYTFAKRLETGASAADGKSVVLSVIQRLLGHARTETTVRYLRAGWDELGAAVERM